jgi:hypothetical protein
MKLRMALSLIGLLLAAPATGRADILFVNSGNTIEEPTNSTTPS